MSLSSNSVSLDISNNLQHNLYYEGQLLSMIPELLKHVKRHTKGQETHLLFHKKKQRAVTIFLLTTNSYLVDVVETAHFFMKMYEKFSTDRQSIIIQKKRKSRAKTAKPKKKKGKDGDGEAEESSPSKSFREEKLDFKIFQLVRIPLSANTSLMLI